MFGAFTLTWSRKRTANYRSALGASKSRRTDHISLLYLLVSIIYTLPADDDDLLLFPQVPLFFLKQKPIQTSQLPHTHKHLHTYKRKTTQTKQNHGNPSPPTLPALLSLPSSFTNHPAPPPPRAYTLQSQPSTTSFPTLFQTATFLSLTTSLGGLTGYIRTASTPSLVAGLTIGGLVRPLPIPIPSRHPPIHHQHY